MVMSIKDQDIDYELVAIDNTLGKYESAAAALNYGASIATGEIFVFCHQDIVFEGSNSLRNFVEVLYVENAKECILGAYGAFRGKKKIANNLFEVDSVDECCFAMSRTTWERHKFNEELCDGWHMYAVEFCIRVRKNGGIILSGNYDIKHLSSGNVDECYMKTFKKILLAYKEEKWITTTCKSLPTNLVVYYSYYLLWKVKKILFGNYPFIHKLKTKIKR